METLEITFEEQMKRLNNIINNSSKIVFFGGAGTSTDCGLPDFRSANGLYNKGGSKYKYPPETMLSHSFYKNHTEEFFEFYKNEMIFDWAKPNDFHKKLVELEKCGKLHAIITQNIDGLHQKAGSKTVYEIHGSTSKNNCTKCNKFYTEEFVKNSVGIPKCTCGGIIKPDVTLYEEQLPQDTVNKAIQAISGADTLIIAGTSLSVYPAANYVDYFCGDNIIIINKQSTSRDGCADLVIRESVTKVFKNIII